jgi:hypothetical protein
MQVSDNLWAFVSRHCIRLWHLGHEIRNGPKAGSNAWFWKLKEAEALRKLVAGRVGNQDLIMNFDRQVSFPYPDNKRYDVAKYAAALDRMATWLGPLGRMFFAKSAQPFMADLLKAQALEDRQLMKVHLQEIIDDFFQPPVPVEIRWGNKIFRDARLMIELTKLALESGAGSRRTMLAEADQDADEEFLFKQEEAEQAKAEPATVPPLYDRSHGGTQTERGGRPAGQRDAAPRSVALNGAGE